jgi:hypothetical protein
MIWNSIPFMTAIDLLIIAVTIPTRTKAISWSAADPLLRRPRDMMLSLSDCATARNVSQ